MAARNYDYDILDIMARAGIASPPVDERFPLGSKKAGAVTARITNPGSSVISAAVSIA